MRRTNLFVLTLLAGVALVALGFFLSAPIGATTSPVISNPRMEFAPLLFIAGVTLMFGSAAVYELVDDR
jgi:hypothetical protein